MLHPLKALRFVWALARDTRVAPIGKTLYLLVVDVLLVVLLVPEGVVAALVSGRLPVVGPLVAVPADATIDWRFLSTVAYALLALFPVYIAREHHPRVFHPRRRWRP